MAEGEVGRLYVTIGGRLDDLQKSLGQAQQKLEAFGARMQAVGRTMTLGLTMPIIAGMGLAVKAAAEQEEATNTLRASLADLGSETEGMVTKLSEFASAMQKATVYGDESIQMAMAYGKNLGITADKLEDATKAAIGLAARFKLDLNTAMMLVGRASQGQTQMLTRYGIVLGDSLSDQEKFNKLLEIGADSFHLAEAETKTFQGALKQLKNAFGDVMEQFGDEVLPTMKKLVEQLKGVVDWLGRLPDSTKESIVKFGALLAVIGPLVTGLGMFIRSLGLLGGALIRVAALAAANPWVALAAAIAAVVLVVYKLIKAFKEMNDPSLKAVNAAKAHSDAIKDQLDKVGPLIQQYEELARKTNRTKMEELEMAKTLKELKGIMPSIVTDTGLAANATAQLAAATEEWAEAQKQLGLREMEKQLSDAYKALEKQQKAIDGYEERVRNAASKTHEKFYQHYVKVLKESFAEAKAAYLDLYATYEKMKLEPAMPAIPPAPTPGQEPEEVPAELSPEPVQGTDDWWNSILAQVRKMTELRATERQAWDQWEASQLRMIGNVYGAMYLEARSAYEYEMTQLRMLEVEGQDVRGRMAAAEMRFTEEKMRIADMEAAEATRLHGLKVMQFKELERIALDSQERQASAMQSAADKMRGLAERLHDRLVGLAYGETAVKLAQLDRQQAAEEAAAREMFGDTGALEQALSLISDDYDLQRQELHDAEGERHKEKMGWVEQLKRIQWTDVTSAWRRAVEAGAQMQLRATPAFDQTVNQSAQMDMRPVDSKLASLNEYMARNERIVSESEQELKRIRQLAEVLVGG